MKKGAVWLATAAVASQTAPFFMELPLRELWVG